MKDVIEICGTYKLTIQNPGKPIVELSGKNRVVDQGLAKLAALCMSATTQPNYIAIGDSGSAVSATQVALQGSEWQRVPATQAATDNAYQLTASITGVTASRNVQEFGIFSASSGNTLFSRFLPSAFDLEVGGVIVVSWQLEFS